MYVICVSVFSVYCKCSVYLTSSLLIIDSDLSVLFIQPITGSSHSDQEVGKNRGINLLDLLLILSLDCEVALNSL